MSTQNQLMSLNLHSLVAIIVITNIIQDSSRLNQDSYTSEHHMPGIPTQGISTYASFITVHK